jgi:hypothetical protein
VPTPAIVAPLEFTVRRSDYIALGGYEEEIRSIETAAREGSEYGADSVVIAPNDRTVLTGSGEAAD